MEYLVILFYKFKSLENVEESLLNHKRFCENYDYKGRIILSSEGINGTLSGLCGDIEKYINFLQSEISPDIDFKIDTVASHTFDRLTIKHKPEIIKIGERIIY